MAENRLDVAGVEAGYGRNRVLHGVDLAVAEGERVAIVGANGAGKSTLLKVISGVVPINRGEVRFGGTVVSGASVRSIVERGLTHVPEGRRIFSEMTVEENLRLAGLQKRIRMKSDPLRRAYDAFPILYDRRNGVAGLLSGGQQQMLALGRAIVAEPKFLLLDELSLGLAPIIVKSFYSQLQDIFGNIGMVIVEQNAQAASVWVSMMYVMRNGVFVGKGDARAMAGDRDRLRSLYFGVDGSEGS
jgi:branched-chain amino acid transport system ATP-binding protein